MRIIFQLLVGAGLVAMAAASYAQGAPLVIKIKPVHSSPVNGAATFTANGDGFTVKISVSNQSGDNQAVELHKGTCGHLGVLVKTLSNLDGGTSTTDVTDMSMADLAKGPYAVQVEKSPMSQVRTPFPDIACGDTGG